MGELEIERRGVVDSRRRREGGGGFEGAAAARAGLIWRGNRAGTGEVGLRLVTAEPEGCGVVGARRLRGGVEGAQPHAPPPRGVANLGRVPPPRPHPHSAEPRRSLRVSSAPAPAAAAVLRRPRSHRNRQEEGGVEMDLGGRRQGRRWLFIHKEESGEAGKSDGLGTAARRQEGHPRHQLCRGKWTDAAVGEIDGGDGSNINWKFPGKSMSGGGGSADRIPHAPVAAPCRFPPQIRENGSRRPRWGPGVVARDGRWGDQQEQPRRGVRPL